MPAEELYVVLEFSRASKKKIDAIQGHIKCSCFNSLKVATHKCIKKKGIYWLCNFIPVSQKH